MESVEATIFIRVLSGTWPIGFNGQLTAFSESFSCKKIVLSEFGDDRPITDNGNVDLSHFVVSVELFGGLVVSCEAWKGEETMQDDVSWCPSSEKTEKKGKSCGILTFVSDPLEVLVAWSPIRPVCEELVSISETVYAK